MRVVEKTKEDIGAPGDLEINPKEANDKRRVPTGLPQLDLLIGGGFPKGKTYLIAGESGTGKTIFATAFVLKGLMEGEKAVYVSVDEKPSDIVEQAASLGWDMMKYLSEKQLLMLDAAPFFSSPGGLTKEIDIPKTVADLASYVTRLGASRVVIDPVGPLVPSRNSGKRVRDSARSLIRSLREHLSTTNLLVLPSTGADEEWEDYPVAGVIVLKLIHTHKGLARTILVRKMRATPVDLTEHPFRIINGKGIVIEASPATVPVAPEMPPAQAEVVPEIPIDDRNIFEAWNPVEDTGKKAVK